MANIKSRSAELVDAFFSERESSSLVDMAEFIRRHRDDLDADALLELILFDQAQQVASGKFPDVEFYLELCPQMRADKNRLLDIVYGDIRARRRCGETPSPEAVAQRFPEIAAELRKQLALNSWLDAAPDHADESSDARLADKTMSLPTIADDSPSSTSAAEAMQDDEATHAPLPYSDFVIGRKLGGGGMGEVFEAEQRSLGRTVAIKIIQKRHVNDPQIRGRFLREARVVARLRHPHIATVYGIGRTPDGGLFIAMELIRGASLDVIANSRTISTEEAARIVCVVGEAVAHAHARGVVHRDLKPSNVLIEEDGRVVVVDFGLARYDEAVGSELSTPSQVLGTPQYLAPEQIDRSLGEPGPGVDVYGLGCLLYTLLTSRPPFDGRSVGEVLRRALSEDFVPPRTLNSAVSPALDATCRRALRKRPVERHASAEEFVAELRAAMTLPTAVAGRVWPRTVRAIWREVTNRPAMALVGTAIVALFTIACLGTTREPQHVQWQVDLYREGVAERRVSLLEAPQAAATGDALRIHIELSRSAYSYVFWSDSEGTWKQLHPQAGRPDEATSVIDLPGRSDSAMPLRSAKEWDACIVVLRDKPASSNEPWRDRLQPPTTSRRPATPLIVDDRAVGEPVPVNSALVRLAGKERTVDEARPLTFEAPLEQWKQWKAGLDPALGSVHYLVLQGRAPSP